MAPLPHVTDTALMHFVIPTPSDVPLQPSLTIGLLGPSAQSKSALVQAITNKKRCKHCVPPTWRYTHVKIYRSVLYNSQKTKYCAQTGQFPDSYTDNEGRDWQFIRYVSFVDGPNLLAAALDAALVLASPQSELIESTQKINNWAIIDDCQNIKQRQRVRSGSGIALPPSVQSILEYICNLPIPRWDLTKPPQMRIIQSVDPNRPGQSCDGLKGGVAYGSITQGVFRVGDIVELRPGRFSRDRTTGRFKCTPLVTRIQALHTDETMLTNAAPGGLICVSTTLDPTLTRSNRLIGQFMGPRGTLPLIYTEIDISYQLLLCAKNNLFTVGEVLMANIGATTLGVKIIAAAENKATFQLSAPICGQIGDLMVLSRRRRGVWQPVGRGSIESGVVADVIEI
ncbi:eukaryotic translation initiation factor 2 subunit 3 [Thraustotheca clavata]|uniref:Eukaryotic translation initiation factor 2 subunit 3 n=1 Tax=Thraustotheca clavata TaxID=74557 RepID=A0A1V9ZP26_9STRA|nr:eukaryotic translation initiation factor 2 subunit 3 [Thraustotheca clavata]